MTTSRTCSWCHALVTITTVPQECPSCGHDADRPRLDCTCPTCSRVGVRLGPWPDDGPDDRD